MSFPKTAPRTAPSKRSFALSERARDLVKQILAFSRKQDLVKQHVDLTLVTREALQMLRATRRPASISSVRFCQYSAMPASCIRWW